MLFLSSDNFDDLMAILNAVFILFLLLSWIIFLFSLVRQLYWYFKPFFSISVVMTSFDDQSAVKAVLRWDVCKHKHGVTFNLKLPSITYMVYNRQNPFIRWLVGSYLGINLVSIWISVMYWPCPAAKHSTVSCLYLLSLQVAGENNEKRENSEVEIKSRRSLTSYRHRQSRLNVGNFC